MKNAKRDRQWRQGILVGGVVILLITLSPELRSIEFYEKPEIVERMEKREVISLVKVIEHASKPNTEILIMQAAGILDGVTIPRAMELMSDYNNLQRVAPEYIKLSELIVRKTPKGRYRKYLRMKTEVKTVLMTYGIEIYARLREEQTPNEGIVHWKIVSASELGRKLDKETFVGLNGQVVVRKHARSSAPLAPNADGRGHYRSRRSKKDPLLVLFQGRLEREDVSVLVPNFIMKFAMEVALQRVGVHLRNFLETAKDEAREIDLERLAEEDMSAYPDGSSVTPASE